MSRIMSDQVPTEEVLHEEERNDRLEKLEKLKNKTKPYFKILERVATSDLEKALTTEGGDIPDWMWRNDDAVSEAEELLRQLQGEHNRKETENRELWADVSTICDKLVAEGDLRLGYSIARPNIRKALAQLQKSITEAEDEKATRLELIKVSTINLRAQLESIWKLCHISDEEKAHFMTRFASQDFSEDLHEAHVEELRIWTHYQKRNSVLMEKVARREAMWKEMLELEGKAEDPTRFVNRGATLLKDQNTLGSLRKNLPKVEQELVKLANAFAVQHGRSFKVHGKEVQDLIAQQWAEFNDEKAKKKFLRTIPQNNGAVPTAISAPVHPIATKTPMKRSATPSRHPPTSVKRPRDF